MQLSKEFAYVGLVSVEYAFVTIWMGMRVGNARRKFGVKYPTMYATVGVGGVKDEKSANQFNCIQRGHQNTLETTPTFFILLVLASLSYPLYAAIAGQVWVMSRVVYFLGYSSGDPQKRLRSVFGYVGLLGLLGMSLATCIQPLL
eukprot:gene10011-2185_t